MGGPTLAGAELPPIDPDAMTASELRELMIALGLPVSEHLTPQETEAAQALAKVLPEQAWALLLNPGMTVRLEGAQGLAENSLEASLSRVQVAPGGERSQVLELSASLAVEAGLRSEALRRAITPELIDRLPEGVGKTVRGWKAAKELPLEIALEASAGERFTYQAVVPADVGARIAAGDMRAAPNPTDPLSMPVGSSVLIRGEDFTAQSLSARYKWLQFDETITALEGQGLGIRRVDQNVFEVTTGPVEAMERDTFFGVGLGDWSVGAARDTRIEGQTIVVAQLDLSTPEGKLAYENFMQTGAVPTADAVGVVRAGTREQVSVSDAAGVALNVGPLGLSTGVDAGLEATGTRWSDGTGEVATVWHYPSSGTYSRTHSLDTDGAIDPSSRRWTATFQGVDADTASKLYDVFSDQGGPRVGFPESVTVKMEFSETDLMQLRDRASELDARKFSQGDDSWSALAEARTPGEVFEQVFAKSNRKDAADIAFFFLSMQKQSPEDGALSGGLGFLSETTVPVQVSTRGQSQNGEAPTGTDAMGTGWVENHRVHEAPPQVTTTLPDLSLPPAEADSLDDLVVPGRHDPTAGIVGPPAMVALPEVDAAPVVSDAPESGKPPAATSSTPEPSLPPAAGDSLDDLVLPGGTGPIPGLVAPPTMAAAPGADATPDVGNTPVEVEPLPPVPVPGAEMSTEPADPVKASPEIPRAPGYDMQDGLLRLNEEGLGVLGLQTALKKQGFDVPTDMRFGPETEQALRDFQARHGLKVDGIVGPQTFAALDPRSATHMADGLIRQPDRGVGVLGTQTALRQLGHSELAADSVFGPQTERAVREFQQAHGLVVDGIVGPNTSAALVAVTRSLSPREAAAEPIPDEQGTRLGSAGSRSALSPDQQRHLQLAREQLGPALSALGHRPEQVERICVAAMALAQQHAERGPVKAFLLSKDGKTVAVLQQGAPMSEMDVAAALQVSGFPAEASAQTREAPQCGEAIRSGPGRAMV